MENRQLPRLALRPVNQNRTQFQPEGPWPLPPIRTARDSEGQGLLQPMKNPSLRENGSPIQSYQVLPMSNAAGQPIGSSRTITPESMVKYEHCTTPESDSSLPYPGPVSQNQWDEYAQRYTLIPESGPIIPPIYTRGQKVEIKQKQNCGRRVQPKELTESDDSDPNRRRRQTEHTYAERNRRNDHKNLLKDIHEQIPERFLEQAGWQDKSKEPIKKMIMEAAVRYLLHMSRSFTITLEDKSKLEKQLAHLRSGYEEIRDEGQSKDRTIAQQTDTIRELTRRLESYDRRSSIASSRTEYMLPDMSASSSFRSEPPTPDGQEMYHTMEPRIPASGPPTPAFSIRSSPLPRSQPVSRPGSPAKALLPCPPILSNNDFQFPTKHKRKPDEQGWVKVSHDDCTDLSQLSPKRARC